MESKNTENQPIEYEDEIELFEIFETLWRKKWYIIMCVVIGLIFGFGYLYTAKYSYQSKIAYKPQNIPPLIDNYDLNSNRSMVLTIYSNNFYSAKLWDEWKKISNTDIKFEEISLNTEIEGYQFSKPKEEANVVFDADKKIGAVISVKSNSFQYISTIFNYAKYINDKLTAELIVQFQDELTLMEETRSNSVIIDSIYYMEYFNRMQSIKDFLKLAEQKIKLVNISNPTKPEQVSPRSLIVIIMSVFLGGIFGVLIIFVQNSYKEFKLRKLHKS